MYIGHGLAEGG